MTGYCEFCPVVGDDCAVCRARLDLVHVKQLAEEFGVRHLLMRSANRRSLLTPTPRFHRHHLRLIARDGQLIEEA